MAITLGADGMIDNNLVIQRFSSALPNYDKYAVAQYRIGEKLISLLRSTGRQHFPQVLEYGCGSGVFTRQLSQAFSIENWTLNDLCPECRDYIQVQPATFYGGEAETMPHTQNYDLIASASAFQWFKDPEALVCQAATLLNPGGIFLFNTFSPDNLSEIKSLTDRGLHYPTASTIKGWLEASFSNIEMYEERIILTFDSPREVLLHLKHTGVTGTSSNGETWTPRRLVAFERAYREQFSTPSGQVRLTYTPLYFIAKINEK